MLALTLPRYMYYLAVDRRFYKESQDCSIRSFPIAGRLQPQCDPSPTALFCQCREVEVLVPQVRAFLLMAISSMPVAATVLAAVIEKGGKRGVQGCPV